MNGNFFSGLRLRLTLFVLTPLVPALLILWNLGVEHQNHARTLAFERASHLVEEAADVHEDLVRNAQQILLILSTTPQVQRQDPDDCSRLFTEVLRNSEAYLALSMANMSGELMASSWPVSRPGNLADRPWFQRVRETLQFVIGEYEIERASGIPVLPFAHPVLDGKGRLQSVLFLEIDLLWLSHLVKKNGLPWETTLTVADRNGTVLFRHPEPDKFIGKPVPEKLAVALKAGGKGTVDGPDLDDTPRLYGFTSLGRGAESI